MTLDSHAYTVNLGLLCIGFVVYSFVILCSLFKYSGCNPDVITYWAAADSNTADSGDQPVCLPCRPKQI